MSPEVEQVFDNGTAHLAMGELEEAAACYQRCVEIDAAFYDGWHALGMALMKIGRYPEAIEAGLKSVQLQPNEQLGWSSLSLFYVRAGRIADAEAAGAKARILAWGGKVANEDGTMRDLTPQ